MIFSSKKDLLILDNLFVLGCIMTFYATDYFVKANASIVLLICFVLLACFKRHIKYNCQPIN